MYELINKIIASEYNNVQTNNTIIMYKDHECVPYCIWRYNTYHHLNMYMQIVHKF